MQTLSRQIRRGNAVIAFNNVTKSNEVVQKKGTPKTKWNHAVKNRLKFTEDEYCENCLAINPKNKKQVESNKEKKRKYEKTLK